MKREERFRTGLAEDGDGAVRHYLLGCDTWQGKLLDNTEAVQVVERHDVGELTVDGFDILA